MTAGQQRPENDSLGVEIRNALVGARETAGLSWADLSGRCRLTANYLRNAEAGKFLPTTGALARWCEALGIDEPTRTEIVSAGRVVEPKTTRHKPVTAERRERLETANGLLQRAERAEGEDRLKLALEAREALRGKTL